jgi:hypothetical protein
MAPCGAVIGKSVAVLRAGVATRLRMVPADNYRKFEGVFFEAEIPSGWEQEIIEDVPCFFDPEGAGALQLAAARSQTERDYYAPAELIAYLDRNGFELAADRVVTFTQADGSVGAGCEFLQGGRYWSVQIVSRGPLLVVVLYNADEQPDAELRAHLNHVKATLRITEAA